MEKNNWPFKNSRPDWYGRPPKNVGTFQLVDDDTVEGAFFL